MLDNVPIDKRILTGNNINFTNSSARGKGDVTLLDHRVNRTLYYKSKFCVEVFALIRHEPGPDQLRSSFVQRRGRCG